MTLLKKIRQLSVHQNQPAPVAISLFYAKEVHNAGSNWDLQEETPLYRASIGRSRFVPPKTSSQHRGISELILASSSAGCIQETEQCLGFNNKNCSASYTSIGVPASSLSSGYLMCTEEALTSLQAPARLTCWHSFLHVD